MRTLESLAAVYLTEYATGPHAMAVYEGPINDPSEYDFKVHREIPSGAIQDEVDVLGDGKMVPRIQPLENWLQRYVHKTRVGTLSDHESIVDTYAMWTQGTDDELSSHGSFFGELAQGRSLIVKAKKGEEHVLISYKFPMYAETYQRVYENASQWLERIAEELEEMQILVLGYLRTPQETKDEFPLGDFYERVSTSFPNQVRFIPHMELNESTPAYVERVMPTSKIFYTHEGVAIRSEALMTSQQERVDRRFLWKDFESWPKDL